RGRRGGCPREKAGRWRIARGRPRRAGAAARIRRRAALRLGVGTAEPIPDDGGGATTYTGGTTPPGWVFRSVGGEGQALARAAAAGNVGESRPCGWCNSAA